MHSTLSRVTSRRMWFVPRLSVWGSAEWYAVDYLAIEEIDSTKSILFDKIGIGDSSQSVAFQELTDFRGNRLPSTINNPRVLIRPKDSFAAFVVGDETNQGFKVAASPEASGTVPVDLIIIEMGE